MHLLQLQHKIQHSTVQRGYCENAQLGCDVKAELQSPHNYRTFFLYTHDTYTTTCVITGLHVFVCVQESGCISASQFSLWFSLLKPEGVNRKKNQVWLFKDMPLEACSTEQTLYGLVDWDTDLLSPLDSYWQVKMEAPLHRRLLTHTHTHYSTV